MWNYLLNLILVLTGLAVAATTEAYDRTHDITPFVYFQEEINEDPQILQN